MDDLRADRAWVLVLRELYEDESTEELHVEALSIRGAEREITGWLISQGFKPAGRWEAAQAVDGERVVAVPEVSRRFVPAKQESK